MAFEIGKVREERKDMAWTAAGPKMDSWIVDVLWHLTWGWANLKRQHDPIKATTFSNLSNHCIRSIYFSNRHNLQPCCLARKLTMLTIWKLIVCAADSLATTAVELLSVGLLGLSHQCKQFWHFQPYQVFRVCWACQNLSHWINARERESPPGCLKIQGNCNLILRRPLMLTYPLGWCIGNTMAETLRKPLRCIRHMFRNLSVCVLTQVHRPSSYSSKCPLYVNL